jgi:hypothetical protein
MVLDIGDIFIGPLYIGRQQWIYAPDADPLSMPGLCRSRMTIDWAQMALPPLQS